MLSTNVSLQPYNTFGIAANARYFARIESLPQLKQVLVEPQLQGLPLLVLGGGSNLLFCGDFDGLVLQMALAGRSIQRAASAGLRARLLPRADAGLRQRGFRPPTSGPARRAGRRPAG